VCSLVHKNHRASKLQANLVDKELKCICTHSLTTLVHVHTHAHPLFLHSALITREKKEHSKVEHGIASLHNDMMWLSTLITEKRGMRRNYCNNKKTSLCDNGYNVMMFSMIGILYHYWLQAADCLYCNYSLMLCLVLLCSVTIKAPHIWHETVLHAAIQSLYSCEQRTRKR